MATATKLEADVNNEEESAGTSFAGVRVGFITLDSGNYPSKFTGFKHGKSKAGEEKISGDFTVSDDESVPEDARGTKQFITLPLGRKGLGITKGLLIDMGGEQMASDLEDPASEVNQNPNGTWTGLDAALTGFIGRDYMLQVEKYQYEGKDQNNVKKIMMME